jgi:predicted glycosyltransferase involved in capsule biosynthesis
MNENEDSNKNINKNMQNDETTTKYVGHDENKLQEMKAAERKRILKVDAKHTRLRRVKFESRT